MSTPEMGQEPNEVTLTELSPVVATAEALMATGGITRVVTSSMDVPVALRVRGGIPYEERLLKFDELRPTGTLSQRARGI